ncbi:MAG TPA: holo-ACP synthase [Myxococcaceae bacterium]|nr:holo-ACP synthase [Myxococcaceae bacterium]
MTVVGLGMDVCSVERIARVLAGPNGQRFRARVFTEAEIATCDGRSEAATAFAARFAAKEALVKALGAPPGVRWRDMEVVKAPTGAPAFTLSGVAAREVLARRARVLLTLSHDAGVAAATVVLDSG